MTRSKEELLTKLNQETGKLAWRELEKHFARGAVVKVSPQLDLLDVAVCMVSDDKPGFARLLKSGQVAPASEADARDWSRRDPVFWAVVVAPWVLVQETPVV